MSVWISQTLAESAGKARTVASLNFPRLADYFKKDLLARVKVVFTDKVPVPPLTSWGLPQFENFEKTNFSGITYLTTYFLVKREAGCESLHFHELVHVIQWELLGAERFLERYVDGFEKCKYRDNLLEVIAYDHEARFKAGAEPAYSVEDVVCRQMKQFCG